jgi:hypothetical protein
MEKKTNTVPCCVDCPNAGKWQKKHTDRATTLTNSCQKYLTCLRYTRWWYLNNEWTTTKGLEVFILEE